MRILAVIFILGGQPHAEVLPAMPAHYCQAIAKVLNTMPIVASARCD